MSPVSETWGRPASAHGLTRGWIASPPWRPLTRVWPGPRRPWSPAVDRASPNGPVQAFPKREGAKCPGTPYMKGGGAGSREFFGRSFLIHPSASCTRARASETSGSTSGDARRRLGVDAGGERRVLLEDAYVVLRFPSLLLFRGFSFARPSMLGSHEGRRPRPFIASGRCDTGSDEPDDLRPRLFTEGVRPLVQSDCPPGLIGGQSAGHQSPCGLVVCPTSMM